MEEIISSIEVLKASYGDCLFVTIQNEGAVYTIMIDGGTPSTYSFKNKKQKTEAGPLKLKLSELREKGRSIDLLIITHVDNDHIGGIIRWFEEDLPSPDFVKRIWMNDDVEIYIGQGLENASSHAAALKKTLTDKGFSLENQKITGEDEQFDWGRIVIIAPTAIQHNRIARDIAEALENTVNNRYDVDINTILAETYICDNVSPENDASIAFILQTNDKKNYLFLGDANIATILSAIKGLDGFEHPIHCEWVKLSHHGSKNNFKPELLQEIEAENYIISTDGTRYGHPDKEPISWIIGRTNAKLWFNYPQRAEKIFTAKDKTDYPNLDKRIESL
ncbi:MAG: MBL fold metallo-hydrolase [Bacteroidales bacterium]|nr:MBL fold metallo-hydrolase [Bacteroidales bacterium]